VLPACNAAMAPMAPMAATIVEILAEVALQALGQDSGEGQQHWFGRYPHNEPARRAFDRAWWMQVQVVLVE
jgi:hypothetical protein